MDPSRALLHDFRTRKSETAFRELVERHVDLVYQTALRRCGGDAALARDAAQAVFTDLARKAADLPPGTVLAGWLHRHTGFVTAKLMRAATRRRKHEHQAAMDHSLNRETCDHALWRGMAPVLDEAMENLPVGDRDALVLRFLEGRDFREVGDQLGLSENSARMRVNRALEKLRDRLRRHGITSTTAALGATLGLAVSAHAPAGLPKLLTAAALEAGPAAAGISAWSVWVKAAALALAVPAVCATAFFLISAAPSSPSPPPNPFTPQDTVRPGPWDNGFPPAIASASLPGSSPPAGVVPVATVISQVPTASPAPAPTPLETARLKLGVVPAVMRFDPALLQVKAGQDVILLFENARCPLQHNFVLTKPGTLETVGALADKMLSDPAAMAAQYIPASPDILARSSILVGIGQSELIQFTAPATSGDYPFLCTFPGHWRLMKGVLRVVP